MTINEVVQHIKEVSLKHKQVIAFQAGMRYNMATGKGESYPLIWLETPVLIDYPNQRNKTYTMAINVLMLAMPDNYKDVVNKQSQTEEIMDDILQALQYIYKGNLGYESIDGLTMENFSDDLAVGCRADFTIITNRNCDSKTQFDTI